MDAFFASRHSHLETIAGQAGKTPSPILKLWKALHILIQVLTYRRASLETQSIFKKCSQRLLSSRRRRSCLWQLKMYLIIVIYPKGHQYS